MLYQCFQAQPSQVNRGLPSSEESSGVEVFLHVPGHLVNALEGLVEHLDRSVMLRTKDIPALDNPYVPRHLDKDC